MGSKVNTNRQTDRHTDIEMKRGRERWAINMVIRECFLTWSMVMVESVIKHNKRVNT